MITAGIDDCTTTAGSVGSKMSFVWFPTTDDETDQISPQHLPTRKSIRPPLHSPWRARQRTSPLYNGRCDLSNDYCTTLDGPKPLRVSRSVIESGASSLLWIYDGVMCLVNLLGFQHPRQSRMGFRGSRHFPTSCARKLFPVHYLARLTTRVLY